MQNSVEESVVNETNNVNPHLASERKCYKSSRHLPPLFFLLTPLIPSSLLFTPPLSPDFSPHLLPQLSLPCHLSCLLYHTFSSSFLSLLPFFSSLLAPSFAFFSPGSLVSTCGSATHSYGCSLSRMGTQHLLELLLLQILGYLPLQ